MVRGSLATVDTIGYEEVIPGRILHVRLHAHKRAIDVVATYQYVDHPSRKTQEQRTLVWDTLSNYLDNMPKRNQLVCLGDYNCSLPARAPWVGTASFRWGQHRYFGPQHSDQESFLQLLQRHGLTALNTWDDTIGPSPQLRARAEGLPYRLHPHLSCHL